MAQIKFRHTEEFSNALGALANRAQMTKGEYIKDILKKGHRTIQDVNSAMKLLRVLIPNPELVKIER